MQNINEEELSKFVYFMKNANLSYGEYLEKLGKHPTANKWKIVIKEYLNDCVSLDRQFVSMIQKRQTSEIGWEEYDLFVTSMALNLKKERDERISYGECFFDSILTFFSVMLVFRPEHIGISGYLYEFLLTRFRYKSIADNITRHYLVLSIRVFSAMWPRLTDAEKKTYNGILNNMNKFVEKDELKGENIDISFNHIIRLHGIIDNIIMTLDEKYKSEVDEYDSYKLYLIIWEGIRLIVILTESIINSAELKDFNKPSFDTKFTKWQFIEKLKNLDSDRGVELVIENIDGNSSPRDMYEMLKNGNDKDFLSAISGVDLTFPSSILKNFDAFINYHKYLLTSVHPLFSSNMCLALYNEVKENPYSDITYNTQISSLSSIPAPSVNFILSKESPIEFYISYFELIYDKTEGGSGVFKLLNLLIEELKSQNISAYFSFIHDFDSSKYKDDLIKLIEKENKKTVGIKESSKKSGVGEHSNDSINETESSTTNTKCNEIKLSEDCIYKCNETNKYIDEAKLNEWINYNVIPSIHSGWDWYALFFMLVTFRFINNNASSFKKYIVNHFSIDFEPTDKLGAAGRLTGTGADIIDIANGCLKSDAELKWTAKSEQIRQKDSKEFSRKASRNNFEILKLIIETFNKDSFIVSKTDDSIFP